MLSCPKRIPPLGGWAKPLMGTEEERGITMTEFKGNSVVDRARTEQGALGARLRKSENLQGGAEALRHRDGGALWQTK